MRVAVIGGGMAGLSAARALLQGGAEAVVFEAAARAGGVVGSVAERGWLTEDGPNFLARPMDPLLRACGLAGEVILPQGPKTRFVHFREKVRVAGPGLLFGLGLGRALLEPFFARPLRADSSVLQLLVDRLGARLGGFAASVLSAGIYAGDPSRLSARDAFPALGGMAERGSLLLGAFQRREKRPIWSLRRGLGSLPEALSGPHVRLGARVERIEASQGGWHVQGERFDALVVAVPACAAAELLRSLAPAFADSAAQIVSRPITVMHLGYTQPGLPRGFGLIDADRSLPALGTLFPSSMLAGRAPEGGALFTCICPREVPLEDVQQQLQRTLGARGQPDYVRVVRHEQGIAQYEVGHRERVRAAREGLLGLPPVQLCGSSWDGVSVPEVWRSGESAAARLLAAPAAA